MGGWLLEHAHPASSEAPGAGSAPSSLTWSALPPSSASPSVDPSPGGPRPSPSAGRPSRDAFRTAISPPAAVRPPGGKRSAKRGARGCAGRLREWRRGGGAEGGGRGLGGRCGRSRRTLLIITLRGGAEQSGTQTADIWEGGPQRPVPHSEKGRHAAALPLRGPWLTKVGPVSKYAPAAGGWAATSSGRPVDASKDDETTQLRESAITMTTGGSRHQAEGRSVALHHPACDGHHPHRSACC